MAKRVKKEITSAKKKASVRRTKKKTTPTKKTPAKTKATSVKRKTPKKSKLVTTKKVSSDKSKKTTRVTSKRSKNNDQHIRISENAQSSKFTSMGERVRNREVEWSYYAIDDNVGYHYYKVLK